MGKSDKRFTWIAGIEGPTTKAVAEAEARKFLKDREESYDGETRSVHVVQLVTKITTSTNTTVTSEDLL